MHDLLGQLAHAVDCLIAKTSAETMLARLDQCVVLDAGVFDQSIAGATVMFLTSCSIIMPDMNNGEPRDARGPKRRDRRLCLPALQGADRADTSA